MLEAGGSEAAVAATAASLALADAGVELFDLVAACCVVGPCGGFDSWGLGAGRVPAPAGSVGGSAPPRGRGHGSLGVLLHPAMAPKSRETAENRQATATQTPKPRQSDVAGQLLLDPSTAEEVQQRGGLLLAAMPSLGEVRGSGLSNMTCLDCFCPFWKVLVECSGLVECGAFYRGVTA